MPQRNSVVHTVKQRRNKKKNITTSCQVITVTNGDLIEIRTTGTTSNARASALREAEKLSDVTSQVFEDNPGYPSSVAFLKNNDSILCSSPSDSDEASHRSCESEEYAAKKPRRSTHLFPNSSKIYSQRGETSNNQQDSTDEEDNSKESEYSEYRDISLISPFKDQKDWRLEKQASHTTDGDSNENHFVWDSCSESSEDVDEPECLREPPSKMYHVTDDPYRDIFSQKLLNRAENRIPLISFCIKYRPLKDAIYTVRVCGTILELGNSLVSQRVINKSVPLIQDPDGNGRDESWRSLPIPIKSKPPDTKILYTYFVTKTSSTFPGQQGKPSLHSCENTSLKRGKNTTATTRSFILPSPNVPPTSSSHMSQQKRSFWIIDKQYNHTLVPPCISPACDMECSSGDSDASLQI